MDAATSPASPTDEPDADRNGPLASQPRSVVVIGSTGSIGTQTLDIVRRNPDRFQVVGIAAGGSDPAALAKQAVEFGVDTVAVAKGTAVEDVQLALYAQAQRSGYATGEFRMPRLFVGPEAATELIENTPADVVVNGIDGSRGLKPTLAALASGADLALANKESLIAGGALVLSRAKPGQIIPVDSEHSAFAQCLLGGRAHDVDRLVLTASGGPFRGWTKEQLADVTLEQALAHPTWSMGGVITINSATLVNKGLELIEAHLLFGIDYDRIDVVVHPQSIVHSMVTFADGSTLAQANPPDMRLALSMGLDWPREELPRRVAGTIPAVSFDTATAWTFEPLDTETFPAVSLARYAGSTGGGLPAIYNAANEEAVAAFAGGHTGFTSIPQTVEGVLGEADQWRVEPTTVDEVFAAEQWARVRARELLGTGSAN